MYNDSSAMTEVALALAMAFFTILVLALVSMGVPQAFSSKQTSLTTVDVIPSSGGRALSKEEVFIIYNGESFFSDQLQPLAVLPHGKPLVVGVPGDLPLSEILDLHAITAGHEFSVTALDPAWENQLKQTTN